MRIDRRTTLMFVIGMILSLGLAGATFAAVAEKKISKKQYRNKGVLSVTTSPRAFRVKIDGQYVGMSGVGRAADFYVTPGVHLVEIENPNGKDYSREINFVKGVCNNICLRVKRKPPPEFEVCRPFRLRVDGPDEIKQGETARFVSQIESIDVPGVKYRANQEFNFRWRVSPSTVRVTTSSDGSEISVDTTGISESAFRSIIVELEVEDVDDRSCIAFARFVVTLPKKCECSCADFDCDECCPSNGPVPFEAWDQIKAELDNYVIELQARPTFTAYLHIYPARQGLNVRREQDRIERYLRDRGITSDRFQVIRGSCERLDRRYRFYYDFEVLKPGVLPRSTCIPPTRRR